MANAPFPLESGETVGRSTRGIHHKSKINAWPGTFTLTNKRFVYYKDGNPMAGFLLKYIFKKQGPHIDTEFPTASIHSISRGEGRATKNQIIIKYGSGQEFKFTPGKEETEWVNDLSNLSSNN